MTLKHLFCWIPVEIDCKVKVDAWIQKIYIAVKDSHICIS